MAIKIFDTSIDKVIQSMFLSGKTNYRFAIDTLVQLISRLDIQRNIQDNKFYRRLEKDILKGCIMPPITLALVVENFNPLEWENKSITEIEVFINQKIDSAFVLDGIQRLNTLKKTSGQFENGLWERNLYLNIVVCGSYDNLLYRMITLNNGQKPMTARHQIEILTNNIYDFEDSNIEVNPEKGRKRRVKGAFDKADMMKAYLAFLSNSIDIDNQKIIEEKLDELIAMRIIDYNVTENNFEFSNVITLIESWIGNEDLIRWIKTPNNLIGFSVGIKKSYNAVKEIPIQELIYAIRNYNEAFSSFKISKFNIGKSQRKLSCYFIENLITLKDYTSLELMGELGQLI